ncbi:MAG: hypothetical protein ACRDNL_05690, partial [Spirillospora sp.]
LDAALPVAARLAGDAATTVEDGALYLRVDPGRAPEVTRALVEAGVDVHEIRPIERSLEEVFFKMTTDTPDTLDAEAGR